MPLGESRALCSQSACRQDRGQASRFCTNRPRLWVWTGLGTDSDHWNKKWLFWAEAFVKAWQLHVRCLAPVARVQKCPGTLLGPHDNAVERAHRGECLGIGASPTPGGAQWAPCGQAAESQARSWSFPVVGGLFGSHREKVQTAVRHSSKVTHS